MSEFRSTLFVVIEHIFISVVVGLECSGPMGLGPVCYDLLWFCYCSLYLPCTYLPHISQMGLSCVRWLVCLARSC